MNRCEALGDKFGTSCYLFGGRCTRLGERSERPIECHGDAVKHWGDRVIVNVDEPISEGWQALLRGHSYAIEAVIPVVTRRYRGLANADKRAEQEVVIVAVRGG